MGEDELLGSHSESLLHEVSLAANRVHCKSLVLGRMHR